MSAFPFKITRNSNSSTVQELDERNEGYEAICKHTLAILITQLRRLTESAFQLYPSLHPSKECAFIKRYLDSNYKEDINLELLSGLIHLNKYHLSHEFTRYYEISDITHLTGFSSQSYLAQSFRKYCGMTSSEHRSSKKKQDF